MKEGTLVFDLETKRLAHEVGGWAHIDRLGLSAAVLLNVENSEITRFLEDDVEELISRILDADMMVGFNLLRFDYEVLRPYGLPRSPDLNKRTIDLLVHVHEVLGFRLSLNNLVEATLNEGKTADGIQAVEWYRQGKLSQVLDYCEQDVQVTHRLWEYGRKNGEVKYRDRNHRVCSVPVSW